jgi:predicted RNase H-like HicB family nuclease
MKYKVELIRSEEGFAVGCPELPGCWSQGTTEEEALTNMQAAIKDYLEVVALLPQNH